MKKRMDELRGSIDNRLSHIVAPVLRYEAFAWFYVLKSWMKVWTAQRVHMYW